jgi:competence protein ComEC
MAIRLLSASDISPVDKNYQYTIQPYLDSCKVTDTIVSTLKRNLQTSFLQKHGNTLSNSTIKRVLIFNRALLGKQLAGKLSVDYLYITGNPHIAVKELTTNYIFNTLIIDGSNTNKLVTNLSTEARELAINYKVIKRNNSFIVLSN